MKTTRSTSSLFFPDADAKNFCLELLRGPDEEERDAALAELTGRLDDEVAAEIRSQLRQSRDVDWRLRLLEQLALELDSGLFDVTGDFADELEDPEESDEDGGGEPRLSRRGLGELQELLRALFEDGQENPRLRRKALEVSALSPLPWHEEAVRECWARPEPEWRGTALCCMGHLFPVDFSEEILAGLEAPEDALRLQAVAAADARELRPLGPRILQLAAEKGAELEVRICAIEALPNLRPPGARSLLEKLRGEPAPIGHFAIDALYNLEQNERAAALLDEAPREEPLPWPPGEGWPPVLRPAASSRFL